MKVHAEILTCPTSDTPGTTILLHFDSKRYAFGQFSEGTQRAFMERHVRMSKVSDLFLTGPLQWKNTGGLVGIMLALGDPDGTKTSSVETGKEACGSVSIRGGRNLRFTLATMRRFVFRTGMNLKVEELQEGEGFADENVVVRTLQVLPDGASNAPETPEATESLGAVVNDMFCSNWTMNTMIEEPDLPERDRNPQLSTKLPPKGMTRAPWPASTVTSLPPTTPTNAALCYIVQLHEQRGKFLPALAKKLGVRPGPDFSKLASGQSVTTPSGAVVEPSQVMEPSREGTGIAICDLPGPEYLGGFLESTEWADEEACRRKIGCFFWLVSGGVVRDPRFLAFSERFSSAKHIISSSDICPDRITFKGATKSAVLLNSLDPAMFPEPIVDPTPRQSIDTSRFDLAAPGLQWQLEPTWALKTSTTDPVFNRLDIVNSPAYAALAPVAQEYKHSISALPPLPIPGHDIDIFPLGTGSSLPSRHRNVSSTLVRIPTAGSILLDCGEGTLGQLARLFSSPDQALRDIKLIFISHLHADHHLGFTTLLKRKHALDPTAAIHLVAPGIFHTWLTEYTLAEPGLASAAKNIIFTSCESLLTPTPTTPPSFPTLTALHTVPALHCLSSYCVSFTLSSGFKLSYSGDTRPNAAFIGIGAESTVVVHEATFEDSMAAQACGKKHCTVGEALEVAREMRAQAVVLTHFSQRYPKLAEVGEGLGVRVVVAFDCMRVHVGDLGRAEGVRRGLEVVYREEEEETG